MNAATSATSSAIFVFNRHRRRPISSRILSLTTASASPSRYPRRHRLSSNPFRTNRNPNPNSSPSDNRDVNLSVDLQEIADRATSALTRTLRSSDARIRRFLRSGADAFDDLRTSVVIDPGYRIGFSCRRSSILFVGNLLIWSFAAVVAVRVLMWMRLGLGFGDGRVVRRDRSLGGREVVVGMMRRGRREEEKKNGVRVSVNPLSDFKEFGSETRVQRNGEEIRVVRKEDRMPEWWPESVTVGAGLVADEELKKEADRLVRG